MTKVKKRLIPKRKESAQEIQLNSMISQMSSKLQSQANNLREKKKHQSTKMLTTVMESFKKKPLEIENCVSCVEIIGDSR